MNPAFDASLQQWLVQYLADVHGVAGTVHLHENGGLRLAAAVNIPPPVQRAVEWVPSGKGMGGLALERGEPVQTCNLKEDETGAVKPGAKAVDAKAAVAMPIRDAGGAIVAVLGVAFADDRVIENDELERLRHASESFVPLVA